MTPTMTVSLSQRALRGLVAAVLWTPVLAPIMYIVINSLMMWLGFAPFSLRHATIIAAAPLWWQHATTAAEFAVSPNNQVDRILHDPGLGVREKLAAISRDRLGGALVLYVPFFVVVLCTTRF